MDSGEEDITRQVQVRQSLNALLETLRLEAVEGPVRQQFESELRALTDAEQDSKELQVGQAVAALRADRRDGRASVPGRLGRRPRASRRSRTR